VKNVEGKTAVITGGASGIGFGMASVFADAGMNIVLLDIEQSVLDGAVKTLKDQGAKAVGYLVDVTNRAAMADIAEASKAAFGEVNILCNNAGVNAAGPIDQLTYEDWDWVLGVNLNGVVNGLVSYLPELKRHGADAHIVNTASVGGLLGMANLAPYNASKFAVVGISESLRADLAEVGVGVSVLCPGIVRTNLESSSRNRPMHLKKTGEIAGPGDGSTLAAGADPLDIGQEVLEAIQTNKFFICTHPEFKDFVRQRNGALEAAFHGNADPEAVTAMSAILKSF